MNSLTASDLKYVLLRMGPPSSTSKAIIRQHTAPPSVSRLSQLNPILSYSFSPRRPLSSCSLACSFCPITSSNFPSTHSLRKRVSRTVQCISDEVETLEEDVKDTSTTKRGSNEGGRDEGCEENSAGGAGGEEMEKTEFSMRWRWDWAKRILVYGLPAISIPIADPLMTAVDTIFVGQGCDTTSLASLGPTGNIISVMSYAFGFLSVVTIKRISEAQAREKDQEVGALMQQALLLAAGVGGVLVLLTQLLAVPLLTLAGTNSDTLAAALAYLRIRILAQPAVILCSVSQSGLLAMKDSTTPLKAILTMCVLNCVGDTLMVAVFGLGISGIAWATVVAQYSAVAVLFHSWSKRPKAESPFSRRPLPTAKEMRLFSADFGTLWGISSLRTLCYSCVRLAAAALGTLPCAAHTALYAVWMPLCFTPFPLRQAAIVYLPPFIRKPSEPTESGTSTKLRSTPWAALTHEGQEILKVLMALGLVFGVTAGLMVLIPSWWAPGILTRDQAVLPLVRTLALPALVALSISGVMEIAEGVLLIGTKADNNYLLRSMAVTIVMLNVALQLSHRFSYGLTGVWWSLVGFYILRVFQPVSHILRNTMVPQENTV